VDAFLEAHDTGVTDADRELAKGGSKSYFFSHISSSLQTAEFLFSRSAHGEAIVKAGREAAAAD